MCNELVLGAGSVLPLTSVGKKRKRSLKTPLAAISHMAKDEPLGLFHGIGRVLNPKRAQIGDSWRLQYDFDHLIDEFSTQPVSFNAFLYENYLKYFGDLEEAQKAADVMSESHSVFANWSDCRDTLLYALWLTVLGFMVFNEHRQSKWTHITAPTKILRECAFSTQTNGCMLINLFLGVIMINLLLDFREQISATITS